MDNISQSDSFLQLIDRLGELEVVIGERARPVVAEVRNRLKEAASARERGDVPGALAIIGQAMARLAGLASHLDAAEGAMMHAIAGSFAQASERRRPGRRQAGGGRDAEQGGRQFEGPRFGFGLVSGVWRFKRSNPEPISGL